MAPLSQFYIRILLNGPQDGRPGKFRFGYVESPAEQPRNRELPDTVHNPNELGRIRILPPVVSKNPRTPLEYTPGREVGARLRGGLHEKNRGFGFLSLI